MGYFYAAMWFAVGLILIFSVSKENRIFYFIGGFFLLLGGWWLADVLLPGVELFRGVWGTVLRVITFAALAGAAAVFGLEYRRNTKKAKDAKKQNEKPRPPADEDR